MAVTTCDLPVPGGPVITVRGSVSAWRTAVRCSALSCAGSRIGPSIEENRPTAPSKTPSDGAHVMATFGVFVLFCVATAVLNALFRKRRGGAKRRAVALQPVRLPPPPTRRWEYYEEL